MTDRYKQAITLLETLAARWPKCFFIFENRRKQLKIGIYEEVAAALGDTVNGRDLCFALKIYCTNPRYRSRLMVGATRIDLNGEAAGVVTEKEVPPKASPVTPKMAAKAPRLAAPPPKRLGFAGLKAAAAARKAVVTCPPSNTST